MMYPIKAKERLDTMSNKLFTPEEIAALRESPYVESVSKKCVAFTPEFKRLVYKELLAGNRIDAVLEAHGIDTGALGKNRLRGMQEKLFKAAGREEGFTNLKKQPKQKASEKEITTENRIRRLETELAYTKQEVEFLKKVQAADMEARKAWESKHRQK